MEEASGGSHSHVRVPEAVGEARPKDSLNISADLSSAIFTDFPSYLAKPLDNLAFGAALNCVPGLRKVRLLVVVMRVVV